MGSLDARLRRLEAAAPKGAAVKVLFLEAMARADGAVPVNRITGLNREWRKKGVEAESDFKARVAAELSEMHPNLVMAFCWSE